MKLFISYYGNYVSIVEGKYNSKKDKYIIKDSMFISSEDVEIDYDDKYSLLKQALKLNDSKVKDIVLCLNTKDVIVKYSNIHKVNPKDLAGIMSNEMDEIMSLDYDQYTFSYEVTKETVVDDKETLDVIVAAIRNEEVESIINIFKENKLNLQRIDTMSTAYIRLLKKIEYDNIMMLNIGSYGSIVNIFKEDSLFIYDNIPVRINDKSNDYVYRELVEEIKGLMNYYSSRNFGNNIETLLLVGQAGENKEAINSFRENFTANIVSGIENLFDIEEDIIGDLSTDEISKACDILGTMSLNNDRKSYSSMNLLPLKHKKKQNKSENIKQYLKAAPVALAIIFTPYLVFGAMEMRTNNKIEDAQSRLNEILADYENIKTIDNDIESANKELEIYDMLLSKKVKWGDLLTIIDNNVPYKVDLTNINVSYDSSYIEGQADENKENSNEEVNNEENQDNEQESDNSEGSTEESEVPIYNQIPNVITIDGEALHSTYVGQFVYNLNKIPYFKSVELKNTTEDEEKGVHKFNIVLVLKEGVVSVE